MSYFPKCLFVFIPFRINRIENVKHSKNPNIRTLNFESQVVVGFYLMVTNSNIKLLGS